MSIRPGGGGAGTLLASGIAVTPTGTIASTDVQAALAELDSEKVSVANSAPLADPAVSAQAPADPASTANTGSLTVVARADHQHPSRGLWWWCGDGGHGDLNFDGTTVNVAAAYGYAGYGPFSAFSITASGGVYTLNGPLYARNLTVGNGIRIKTNGHPIFVQRTLTLTGTGKIDADGSNASGATGGTGAGSGSNDLSDGGGGATGGTGVGGAGASPSRNAIGRSRHIAVGGNGGASGATAGGTGAGATIYQDNYTSFQILNPMVRMTGYYFAGTAGGSVGGAGGGGAGAGDGTNAGGGGGGGGGILIVNARKITGSGTLSANGGNGAAGVAGNAGGGGAGGGGAAFINVTDTTGWTGTIQANSGTAGAGSGTGVAGTVAAFGIGTAILSIYA